MAKAKTPKPPKVDGAVPSPSTLRKQKSTERFLAEQAEAAAKGETTYYRPLPGQPHTFTLVMRQLRSWIRAFYDIQKLRNNIGNKIIAAHYALLGIGSDKSKEQAKKEDKKKKDYLDALPAVARRVPDQLVAMKSRGDFKPSAEMFNGQPIIADWSELCLMKMYTYLLDKEHAHEKYIADLLPEFPIWNEFLSKIHGLSTLLAASFISEFDMRIATTPAKLFSLCGLGRDKLGRMQNGHNLIWAEYLDKDGKIGYKESLSYNKFLKMTCFKLSTGQVRQKGPYCSTYYDYKARKLQDPAWAGSKKARFHMASLRFISKAFLVDLWNVWRPLEGLDVRPGYAQEKLHMPAHDPWIRNGILKDGKAFRTAPPKDKEHLAPEEGDDDLDNGLTEAGAAEDRRAPTGGNFDASEV